GRFLLGLGDGQDFRFAGRREGLLAQRTDDGRADVLGVDGELAPAVGALDGLKHGWLSEVNTEIEGCHIRGGRRGERPARRSARNEKRRVIERRRRTLPSNDSLGGRGRRAWAISVKLSRPEWRARLRPSLRTRLGRSLALQRIALHLFALAFLKPLEP